MKSALAVPNASNLARPARFTSLLVLIVWLMAVVAQAGMLAYLPPVESYRASAGIEASPQSDPVMIAFTFLMASFGAVIVLRAASRRYGWLMLATGFSLRPCARAPGGTS